MRLRAAARTSCARWSVLAALSPNERLTDLVAQFRKSLSLQSRQKVTLCCQVIFPLVLILFLWIMQIISTHSLECTI